MTEKEAREIALRYLKPMERWSGCELVILDSETVEKSFGWIFFYQSGRYLESGNFSDTLAGNAPIIVARADGRVHVTGTAFPLEYYLDQLARAEGWNDQEREK